MSRSNPTAAAISGLAAQTRTRSRTKGPWPNPSDPTRFQSQRGVIDAGSVRTANRSLTIVVTDAATEAVLASLTRRTLIVGLADPGQFPAIGRGNSFGPGCRNPYGL